MYSRTSRMRWAVLCVALMFMMAATAQAQSGNGTISGLVRDESGGAVPIDVLPRPPRPKGLPEGTIWRPRPRYNIPGSVWLPNTGFGALSEEVEGYFHDNLESLTEGDKDRPLLFYCLADCWMSWNAAKRAIAYGYTGVRWFPEGTDAWTAMGLPTEKSDPVPGWAPE